MHGLEIKNKSGSRKIHLEQEGFTINDIRISFPEQENTFNDIEGVAGRFHSGSRHTVTTIEVDVEYHLDYELDFPLFRDKLMGLVSSTEPFYIREKRVRYQEVEFEKPGDKTGVLELAPVEYASGKQYFVLRSGSVNFDKVAMTGSGTITFETAKLPYAESVYSSYYLDKYGLNYDGSWSYGMGLEIAETDPSVLKYRFSNQSKVKFYNPGDVAVNDWRMERSIVIQMKTSVGFLIIVDSVGEVFTLSYSLYPGDLVVIDGPRVTVNGRNVLAATNGYFPKIVKGWNEYEFYELSQIDVTFDFKFYYGGTDLDVIQSTVVADKTPPNAPVVNNITPGATTITGTSEEGATVSVKFPNGTIATGTAGLNGNYSIAVPTGISLTANQTVTVNAKDKSGNLSTDTIATVRDFQYSAPTVDKSLVYLDVVTKKTDNFTVSNMPLGKELTWKEKLSGWLGYIAININTHTSNTTDMLDGDTIELYYSEPGTHERLSPSTFIEVKAKQTTSTNLWRSSNKDYSSTLNSTGIKQITEIFSVIGNNAQEVDVKTSGDTLIVDGNAGDMRFYEFSNLKPNTKYTLSYDVTWTDTTAGLHTHSWGVGVLYDSSKGTRQSFTFTTNSFGKYGYGQGATMDPPASSMLNAMNASVSGNLVTYSKITLNEGSIDLGYTAGTTTGV